MNEEEFRLYLINRLDGAKIVRAIRVNDSPCGLIIWHGNDQIVFINFEQQTEQIKAIPNFFNIDEGYKIAKESIDRWELEIMDEIRDIIGMKADTTKNAKDIKSE